MRFSGWIILLLGIYQTVMAQAEFPITDFNMVKANDSIAVWEFNPYYFQTVLDDPRVDFRKSMKRQKNREQFFLDTIQSIVNTFNHVDHYEFAFHTDCRAPAKYNKALSQIRADSFKNYLSRKTNLNLAPFLFKGYGESRLKNGCWCEEGKGPGKDCPDKKHRTNRRTEFILYLEGKSSDD